MAVRYLRGNTKTLRYKNGTTALSEWGFVQDDGSGALSAAGDGQKRPILGVCPPVAASAEAVVYQDGFFEVDAASGVNFQPGEYAYLASAQTVDKGSNGDLAVGMVVDRDPASGGKVRLMLLPEGAPQELEAPYTSAKRIARGTATFTGSQLNIATGLSAVEAVVASLEGSSAPGLNSCVVTVADGTAAGQISLYAWMPTAANNATLIAGTNEVTVNWIAFGTP